MYSVAELPGLLTAAELLVNCRLGENSGSQPVNGDYYSREVLPSEGKKVSLFMVYGLPNWGDFSPLIPAFPSPGLLPYLFPFVSMLHIKSFSVIHWGF